MCETFNRLSRVQVQSELCTQVPDMQTCPSKLRALQRRALFSRNYHCRQLVRCFFQALRFGHFIPPTQVHGFHSHTHTHSLQNCALELAQAMRSQKKPTSTPCGAWATRWGRVGVFAYCHTFHTQSAAQPRATERQPSEPTSERAGHSARTHR